jgi:2'-5' RNA ligase
MRLFIAVELPPPAKQHVAEQQEMLRQRLAADAAGDLARAWRWTPSANLHLTLRFLGETSAPQQRAIEAALAAAAAAAGPFALQTGTLGAFPNLRRPSILWLNLGGGLAQLAALQERAEQAARAEGFAAETRPFTPHLTIARARKDAAPAALTRTGDLLRLLAEAPAANAPAANAPAANAPAANAPAANAGTASTGTANAGEPFAVTAIHLFASDLRPSGPTYHAVASFALLGCM